MFGPRNLVAIAVKHNCKIEILSAKIHQHAVMVPELEF
jgi:hypothetical protein